MAYKYIGDSTLGVGLTVTAPKPLDNRTVVENSKLLYDIPKSSAYQGMTVANVQDGNIYMLVDKDKISLKTGWKASYESLLIITCSLEEYDKWAANTTEDFNPINPEESYLYPNTYYYIFEDDQGQYYLSSAWGKDIEELMKKKAEKSEVVTISNDLATKYTTTEIIKLTYVPQTDLDLDSPESFLSVTLAKYYTILAADKKFVTREELLGDSPEGSDFIFVTKQLYEKEQLEIQSTLKQTLKTDADGSLNSITLGLIKSKPMEDEQLIIDVKKEGLFINNDALAKISEVPKIITLPQSQYDKLVEEGQLKEDTYYYTYDDEDVSNIYVTKKFLEANYDSIKKYQTWVSTNYCDNNELEVKLQTTLKDYYTSLKTDLLFLKLEEAKKTYTNQSDFNSLQSDLKQNYVTKEDLKGDAAGDDDFVFVTKSSYTSDKEKMSQEFKTLKIIIDSINLTDSENHLFINGKQAALLNDVPIIECLPQDVYNKKVEENLIQEDVYYYTYNPEDNKNNGYLTLEYADSTYCKNSKMLEYVNSRIIPLEQRVVELEQTVLNLNELVKLYLDTLSTVDKLQNTTILNNKTLIKNGNNQRSS